MSWIEGHWRKEQDPEPDPDPLFRGRDPRIRIHTKMSRIRNTGFFLGRRHLTGNTAEDLALVWLLNSNRLKVGLLLILFRITRHCRAWNIDQITMKTPNTKCRLYWCLTEFIDWRNSQSCYYLVTGGGRGWGYVENMYRSNTLCIWLNPEPTKLLFYPKQNLGGEGASETCRQVPLLVNF